jgi:hypoxanthine phosphoribosyltransferase
MAEPPPDSEREVLTWDRYGTAARQLAQAVLGSGYRPDVIISIARGGLAVAGSLAYALGIKNVHVMNVEYYTGIGTRLDVPVVLPPVLKVVDIRGLRVLVADDVADTGHTLKLVTDFVAGEVAEVRCAVLFQKPTSVVDCSYVWASTDRWIDFPWSSQGAVLVEGAGA